VTDSVSGDPIQNATVRFFRTGETESKATNTSGVATFTVEAATWSYAIVANGYAGASGSVVVSADGDTPVTMVANRKGIAASGKRDQTAGWPADGIFVVIG
jgi:hypothetical protein